MRRAADLGGQAALAAMTVLAMFFKIGANILIKNGGVVAEKNALVQRFLHSYTANGYFHLFALYFPLQNRAKKNRLKSTRRPES